MSRPTTIVPLLVVLLVVLLAGARPARAQGAYEIQVYGADVVERGRTMLELHTNVTATGSRLASDPSLASTLHALHATVEATRGVAPWLEVGFYLLSTVQPGSGPAWVGTHIRPRVRAPAAWRWPVGVSLSAEFGYERARYTGDTWTIEIRPIVDQRLGRWYWSVNPTVEHGSGGGAGGWDFAPSAAVRFDATRAVTIGLEYYGGFGPIGDFAAPPARWQQFFPAVDLNLSPDWEFNAGIGIGLTAATDRLAVKTIVGHRF